MMEETQPDFQGRGGPASGEGPGNGGPNWLAGTTSAFAGSNYTPSPELLS